jgi:hypothetical protein
MRHAGANILAIRPELFPSDYQSPAHLRLKLADLLDKAKAEGLLYRDTVVACRAISAHGSCSVGKGPKYTGQDFREVVRQMALSHLGRLAPT